MIIDPDDFALYIREETGVADIDMTAQALAAGEQWVTTYCRRSFQVADATPTPRVFKPLSPRTLFVDDFIDIGLLTISNNGTAVSPNSCEIYPLNGLDSGVAVPFQEIELHDSAWRALPAWSWPSERATVTVTARWGWASVPDAVYEAVKLVGKDHIQQRTSKFGVIETSAGPASAGRNFAAMRLLDGPFRRLMGPA